MFPTNIERNRKYIKVIGNDAPIAHEDWPNVTIDGEILHYVRRRMGCERVTREVYRQAVAFEREMSRMSGW